MAKRLTQRKRKWIERTVDNDRSYRVLVYNRAFTCIALLFLQMMVMVAWLLFTEFGWVWNVVIGVLSVVYVLYLAGRERRLPTRTLWIILLLLVPFAGLPLYLIYGDGKPTAKMWKRYKKAGERIDAAKQAVFQQGETEASGIERDISQVGSIQQEVSQRSAIQQDDSSSIIEQGRAGAVSTLLNKMGYETYADGTVAYYPTGEQLFEAMKESVSKAEKFILIETFILSGGKMWGELLTLLLQKAEEGVQVKIIYDDFGSVWSLPPYYWAYVESLHKNVKCMAFNKVYPIFSARYNHRDHRKIFVVDGKVGFTGGVNIADEYIGAKERFGYWKDTGIKIEGRAVQTLTRTFLETWVAFKEPKLDLAPYMQCESGGGNAVVAACADSPLDEIHVSESVFLEMINRAEKTLYITTPYLILDELLRDSLALAAARGVDVRIVTPAIPDKKAVFRLTRANYEVLLKAGVRIYEYTPGFMHAKMTLSDGYAIVGSTNYDYRSLYLHFENMVYFKDEAAVSAIEKDFEEIFFSSKERTLQDGKQGFFGKLIDTFLRIFEPLL